MKRFERTLSTLWMLSLLMTTLSACSTPSRLLGDPETPYAPTRPPEVGDILHMPTGSYVSEEAMLAALADVRVVFAGETHDNPASHRLQLNVLKAMQERWPGQVALGMEMFTPDQQPTLDAWTSGELSEKAFLKESGWFKGWSMDYAFYRELLDYAREQRIPVRGLNVDKQLRRRVGRTPLEELDEETRARLPEMDFSDPYQRGLVEAIYGGHDAGKAMLEGFVRVQTLWDESMAQNAAAYLESEEGRGRHMLIVAGGNHIRYGFGIPRRLYRRLPLSYASVGGREIVIPEDKQDRQMDVDLPRFPFVPYDFMVFTTYEDLPGADRKVKLGVQFEDVEEGLKVTAVVAGSAAAEAGLQEEDILTAIDGEPLRESFDLVYPLSLRQTGDKVTLELLRGVERVTLEVTLRPLEPTAP